MRVRPIVFRKLPEKAEIEIGTSTTCCSRFCAVTTMRLRSTALAVDGALVVAGAAVSLFAGLDWAWPVSGRPVSRHEMDSDNQRRRGKPAQPESLIGMFSP